MTTNQLMDTYQEFIHQSRYSRWSPEENRRESWEETVQRYVEFWSGKYPELKEELHDVREAILGMHVMPSMRALWSAGPALDKNNFRGYNCSFVAVDHPRVFDEALYILMAGTGLGFSAEAQFVGKLPIVNDEWSRSDREIYIGDSAEGWAKGLRKLIADLYLGSEHTWNYSRIRKKGAKLKTMGGRASGPEPLMELFEFVTNIFKNAKGRKLRPIEVHDILCKIGEVVVVGGVRRSALISLGDLSDTDMRDAKSGAWWENNVQRALANNSAVYEEKPSLTTFLEEWTALIKSGSGERGIVSRYAMQASAPERRDETQILGLNPLAN